MFCMLKKKKYLAYVTKHVENMRKKVENTWKNVHLSLKVDDGIILQ